MANDKKLDLTGVDDIYKTPSKDETKKLDLSGLDEIYNPEAPSQLEAGARGVAQGLTSNFEPRIVGGVQGLYHKAVDSGTQKLADLYNKYKEIQEQQNATAENAYPKTYLGGQLAGGAAQLALPAVGLAQGAGVIGTGLKTAALGGLSGLGATQDITANPTQTAVNVAIPAALGGALGSAGKAVANLANPEIAPQLATDIQAAFKQGQAGNNIVGPQAAKVASKEMLGLGQDIQGSLESKGKELGQKLGQVYEGAEASDTNLAEPIKDKMAPILDDLHELKSNQTDPERAKDVQKIIDNIMQGITRPEVEGISPNVAKQLRDTLSARSRLAQSPLAPDTFPALTGQATGAAQGVGEALNEGVPGLAPINAQYSANASAQDLLKTISPLFEKQNLQNQQQIAQIIANAEGSGLKSATAEEFINRIKDYAQQSGNSDLVQIIEDKAPDIAQRFDLTQKAQTSGFSLNPVKLAKNAATLPISTANKLGQSAAAPVVDLSTQALTSPFQQGASQALGRTVGGALIQQGQPKPPLKYPDQGNNTNPNNTKPLELSKDLYSASPDQLKQVTATLDQDPALKSLSSNLNQAIENNDQTRKNSTLFALLQNPRARQLMYGTNPEEV